MALAPVRWRVGRWPAFRWGAAIQTGHCGYIEYIGSVLLPVTGRKQLSLLLNIIIIIIICYRQWDRSYETESSLTPPKSGLRSAAGRPHPTPSLPGIAELLCCRSASMALRACAAQAWALNQASVGRPSFQGGSCGELIFLRPLVAFGFWRLLAFGGCWLLVAFGLWRLLACGGFWLLAAFGLWWLLAFGGFCSEGCFHIDH